MVAVRFLMNAELRTQTKNCVRAILAARTPVILHSSFFVLRSAFCVHQTPLQAHLTILPDHAIKAGRILSYVMSLPRFQETSSPREKLLIFARLPERGAVKTRIARRLGDEATLEIYTAMLADLLGSIGPSSEDVEVEILWTASGVPGGSELRKYFGKHSLARQAGADLGERLNVAFMERLLFHQAEKVVVIGTDDPSLTREIIDRAFKLLDSCDWVIGPATDGGYYLLGCRAGAYRPAVFKDIDWGTSVVFDQTLTTIRIENHCIAVLPRRSDIDFVEDLQTFLASGQAGPHLRVVATTLGDLA